MGLRDRELKRHLSKKDLKQTIKDKRTEAKLFERLLFIKFIYEGESVKDAAEKVEVSEGTGYNWLERWNKGGLEGLKPDFDGGPKSRLTEDQKQDLKQKLEDDIWTTKQVQKIIEIKYGVEYTQRHVRNILKDLGFHQSKPYVKDEKRPDDAEEQLKKG